MKLKTCILALAVLALAVSPAFAAKRVSLATGGTAGTYFPVGGALAGAASKNGKIKVTAETANASVANINLLSTGDIELAMVQNDVSYWAFNGEQMFKDKPVKNLRSVLSIYPEDVHLVVSQASGIKNLADLKGKRVSVGAPGSGTEADVQAIFQVVGLKYDDMKVDRLDYTGTANRFKDEQIDAGFLVTGFPSPAVMDIAATKNINLVNFDKAFLADLNKKFPYFVPHVIPAGTYNKIGEVNTPAVMAMIVAHDKVGDDVVYEFLKGVFDNLDDVQKAHAKAKDISLKTALDGLTVPMHPGAEKFYKEKGMMK